MKKLRVGVIYGGRSGEHEVSVASAASIFRAPRRAPSTSPSRSASRRPAGGRSAAKSRQALSAAAVARAAVFRSPADCRAVRSVSRSRASTSCFPCFMAHTAKTEPYRACSSSPTSRTSGRECSARPSGMDKAVMKTLFAASGLPIVAHLVALRREWERERRRRHSACRPRPSAFPCSSSRRTSDRASASRRRETMRNSPRRWSSPCSSTARSSSRPASLRRARSSARCSATTSPKASTVGEIIPSREFYDYEAKYLDEGSELLIPAAADARTRPRRSSAWRSRRSARSRAPAWRASIS